MSPEDQERRKSLEMIITSVSQMLEGTEQRLRGVDIEEELWNHIKRIEMGIPQFTWELSDSILQHKQLKAILKSTKEELRLLT